jgi:choline kinase
MSDLRAFIVAAGRGSRLRPFTDVAPKCLIPFAGRRLLEWQLSALRANGIDQIGMIRGYKKETLDFAALPFWDNERWEETNMVYSLLRAREALLGSKDTLIAYADIVYEPRIIDALAKTQADIAITVDRNWHALWSLRFDDPLSDAESLRLDKTSRVLDIGRKVTSLDEIEAQYMGLLKFSAEGMRAFIDYYDRQVALIGVKAERLAMTDMLQGLIQEGTKIMAVPVNGGWLEFDNNRDLEAFEGLHARGALTPFFSTAAFS